MANATKDTLKKALGLSWLWLFIINDTGQVGQMKLLLTSIGIANDSIRTALVDLLGKPIAEAKAICIPTALYGYAGGSNFVWQKLRQIAEIGWQELGVLELTALPSLTESYWLPTVEAADVIYVSGGNTSYLSYWMQRSGLGNKLLELLKNKVYIGSSAGSMVVTHSLHVDRDRLAKTGIYYDDEYDEEAPLNAGSDQTWRLVNFVMRPHLNAHFLPMITLANMEKAAAKIEVPLYALDDQTAIKVVDGKVEVISEGIWKLFDK